MTRRTKNRSGSLTTLLLNRFEQSRIHSKMIMNANKRHFEEKKR